MANNKKKKRTNYTPPAPKNASAVTKAEAAPRPAPKSRVPERPQARRGSGSTLSWYLLGGGIVAIIVALLVVPGLLTEDEVGVTSRDAWDLPTLDGGPDPDGDGRVTLAEFEGAPLVVNFFASWCTACDAELPIFDQAAATFEGEAQIVFVNTNETGNWRDMVNSTGIDDQILIKDISGANGDGFSRSLGGTGGLPITAFYNADGTLAEVEFGQFNAARLYTAIDDLLVANGLPRHEG